MGHISQAIPARKLKNVFHDAWKEYNELLAAMCHKYGTPSPAEFIKKADIKEVIRDFPAIFVSTITMYVHGHK